MRFAVLALLSCICGAGCTSHGARAAGTSAPSPTPAASSHEARAAAWPSYAAADYDKPGRPGPLLSPSDITEVQAVLQAVKPCQRRSVRYAFLGNSTNIVLFFAVPPGEGAHVIGSADESYNPMDNSVIPMSDNPNIEEMQKQGVQWDIDHQPCPYGRQF
jgi:hypothetical protein